MHWSRSNGMRVVLRLGIVCSHQPKLWRLACVPLSQPIYWLGHIAQKQGIVLRRYLQHRLDRRIRVEVYALGNSVALPTCMLSHVRRTQVHNFNIEARPSALAPKRSGSRLRDLAVGHAAQHGTAKRAAERPGASPPCRAFCQPKDFRPTATVTWGTSTAICSSPRVAQLIIATSTARPQAPLVTC